METVEQLVDEGVLVVKDYYEDRIDVDMDTGEKKEIRSYYKKYYDTRKFIKTFNPVIDKLVKDFEGNPKAQILEDNREITDINFSYSEFSKICKKHNVKLWTRSQLSNGLRWLVDKEYLVNLEDSFYRINYRYLYNGSLLTPLGLNKPIEQFDEKIEDRKSKSFMIIDTSILADGNENE